MRTLPGTFMDRVNSRIQTIAENAEPRASVIVSRSIVPLNNWKFVDEHVIEYLGVGGTGRYLDIDIAVAHPRYKKPDGKIWVAAIDCLEEGGTLGTGQLRVISTLNKQHAVEEDWIENGFTTPAEACAIAFDSEVERDRYGIEEFVTDRTPWVFYIHNGALYGYQIDTNMLPISLAEANVTDVSAVRGPSGSFGGWNLGLTVFFLMNGGLYYRQLIDGVWYDAELVTEGPSGVTYATIDAFNTWDYRVGVQLMDTNNVLYMLYTYTEGIGTRATEHLEVKVSANVTLTGTEHISAQETEHLEVGTAAIVRLIYGHSVVPQSIQNVEDEDESWGTTIQILFDYPVHSDGLTAAMFTLTDTHDINYVCQSFSISGDGNGRLLTLVFDDFNLAQKWTDNTLTISYTSPESGGLMSPAKQTDSFTETFTPTHLVAPLIDPPAFSRATNDAAGETIYVHFTEEITNADVTGMTGNFGIALHEYDYVPDGTLQDTTRTVASVDFYAGNALDLSGASTTDVEYVNGVIQLEVDDG